VIEDDALDGDHEGPSVPRLRASHGARAARTDEAALGRPSALLRGQHGRQHAHPIEVDLRAGGHRIPAQLVAREARLVEQEDAAALARQVPRAGGADGTRADDADIVEGGGARHGHVAGWIATAGRRSVPPARSR
jgi:hypothetical protein